MRVNGERYYSFPTWCKEHYGRRLYRVALDAGMSCPNRDGTIGVGGCIFCDEGGSGDFAIRYTGQPITRSDLLYGKYPDDVAGNAIAYFQAYTNTYAPIEKLSYLFHQAMLDDFFAGISIATRPDCLPEEVLSLLQELKEAYPNKFIWVELGLQSIHEHSAMWMRRGYPLPVFDQAVQALNALEIPVIVHVIFGLPNETEEDMLATIRHLNDVGIQGIKIQLLQFLDHTDLGLLYKMGKVTEMSRESYIHAVCMSIGLLNPEIAIHRLTGDGPSDLLLAPLWSVDKKSVLNEIRHTLKEMDIVQGGML